MGGTLRIPVSLSKNSFRNRVPGTAARHSGHLAHGEKISGIKSLYTPTSNVVSFPIVKNVRKLRLAGLCGSTRGDNQQPKLDDIFDEATIQTALALLGSIILFVVGAPLIGIALPSIGVVGLVVAIAYFTGQVDKVASAYGISRFNSAAAIAGVVFSILAIPALLKLGVVLAVGLFAANLASQLIGTSGLAGSDEIDASDAIIDVDYESVDD